MKNIIKKIGCEIIYRTGLFRLSNFNTRIITFHKVNPKYFEKQTQHLIKHYNVIPLSKVSSQNKNAVVITFDDGYKNNLLYAYPILKKYNLTATVFVTCEFIDQNTFTWWDRLEYSKKCVDFQRIKTLHPNNIEKEVAEITGLRKNSKKPEEYDFMNWDDLKTISDVFEIGSHTLTHPILTIIPLEDAGREIFESKKQIEERLGKPINSFAYPNGDCNDKVVGLVEKAGYFRAVTYSKGNSLDNSCKLCRRGINIKDNTAIFATKLAGL